MFRVKHKELDRLRHVYATRVDEKGQTFFLIYDLDVKRWMWIDSNNYAPY